MKEETTLYRGDCSPFPVVEVVPEGLYPSNSLPTTSNTACNSYVPGSAMLLKQLFLRRGDPNIFTVADTTEPEPRRSHRTGCVLEVPRRDTHSWHREVALAHNCAGQYVVFQGGAIRRSK